MKGITLFSENDISIFMNKVKLIFNFYTYLDKPTKQYYVSMKLTNTAWRYCAK